MKKTKKTKHRIWAMLLVVVMIASVAIPSTSVQAENTSLSASITATYNSGSDLETVTATDTGNIIYKVVVEKATDSTATVKIDIPAGLELITAPGIQSVTDAGEITAKDYDASSEANYFTEAPTWTADEPVDGVSTRSGTLSYDLQSSVNGATFYISLAVDGLFVPFSYESATTTLGDVTLTLTQGDSGVTDAVTTSVTSQDLELDFSSISVSAVVSGALSSALTSTEKNFISTDGTQEMYLTAKVSMNNPLAGDAVAVRAYGFSFEVTIPSEAIITSNNAIYTIETVENATDNKDGTTSYTVNVGNNPYFSGNAINCGDFAIVDFSGCFDEDTTKGTSYDIKVSDVSMNVQSFNVGSQTFDSISLTTENTEKSMTTTVYTMNEVGEDSYWTYYNTTLSTDTEMMNPYDDAYQTLYIAKKVMSYSSASYIGYYGSGDPVKVEYIAYPTNDNTYLDLVTEVGMEIPFLGSTAYSRYTSLITSLKITLDSDGNSGDDTAVTLDIDAFADAVAAGTYDNGNATPITIYEGEYGTVVYQYTTSSTPKLIITAPEGSSIIGVEAIFDSDNGSYLTSSTSDSSYVKGIPYSDESTLEYSKYQFVISQEVAEGWVEESASAIAGFRWTQPEPFTLTLTDATPGITDYLYNVAEENTKFNTEYSSTLGLVEGYQVLGAATIVNETGTASPEDSTIVVDIDIDKDSNDVVKEVDFPLYSVDGEDGIVSITYEYMNGSKYTYTPGSGSEAPYTVSSDNTYATLMAGDGNSFARVTVVLNNWGTAEVASYVSIQGYLEDASASTFSDADSHVISLTVYDANGVAMDNSDANEDRSNSYASSITVDAKFEEPYQTGADVRVAGQVSTYIEDESGYYDANVLTPGLSSVVSFQLIGGEYNNPSDGTWHDITFSIVLPDGVEVSSIAVGDFVLESELNVINSTTYTTTETVDGITLSETEKMSEEDAQAYFGVESIKGATVYTYTIQDESVALYGYRYNNAWNRSFASFDVSVTLTPDADATNMALSWDKILLLGSDSEAYENFHKIYTKTTGQEVYVGDGEEQDNYTSADYGGVLTLGATDTIITGSSSQYLYIAANPMVMVHDAYITKDGDTTEYHYVEGDDDTIAVFNESEEGTLHFSVTDTVDGLETTTNYAFFALPAIASDESQLVQTGDFAVTIGDVSLSMEEVELALTNGTYTNNGFTIEVKYVTVDGETTNIAPGAAQTLFDSGNSTYASSYNTIALAITGQEDYSTIDVAVDFTVPSYTTTSTEYVEFEGRTVYYFEGSSQTTFYGGVNTVDNTESVVQATSGYNYVSFAYENPDWTVSVQGVSIYDGAIIGNITTGIEDMTVGNNDLVTGLTETTLTGYTFNDWYADDDLTKEFDFENTPITSDTVIYASYTPNVITVTWDGNGDDNSTQDITTVLWSDLIQFPTQPTKTGYTFDGWKVVESGTNLVTAAFASLQSNIDDALVIEYATYGSYAEDDIALYLEAQWTAIDYTLSFDTDGGEAISEETLNYKEEYTLPAPTKTGFVFDGWTVSAADESLDTADDATYAADDDYTMAAEDIVLTAQWTEVTITVTWAYNYDDASNDGVYVESTENWTTVISGDEPDDPERSVWYSFVGWHTDASVSSENEIDEDKTYGDYVTEAIDNGETTLTFYASWSEDPTYSITYALDGGEATITAHAEHPESYDVYLTSVIPTKAGYTFAGWTSSVTADNTIYAAGVTYTMPGEDVTFTAQWEAIDYSITYDLADGTSVTTIEDTTTYNVGATNVTVVSTEPTKTGYTFAGWVATANDEEVVYEDTTIYKSGGNNETLTTMPASNVTFTATWNINTYDVDFEEYGGADVIDVTAADYQSTITLPTTTKTGYTFTGWLSSVTDETDSYAAGATYTIPAENVTFTATWTAIEYKIEYVIADGERWLGSQETDTYNIHDIVTVSDVEPTKMGYTFAGWESSDGGKIYSAEESYTVESADVVFTATWTINQYDVIFDEDGGAEEANLEDKDYASTVILPIPEKTGHDFLHWVDEDKNEYVGGENFTIPASDTALTAIWKTLSYKLTFSDDEKTYFVEEVDYEDIFVLPEPVKEGYTFVEWTYDEKPYDAGDEFTMEAAEDITFTASWTINQYDVTFDYGYDDMETTTLYDFGSSITFGDLEREGYNFGGWSYNGEIYTSLNAFTLGADDVAFTAIWTAKDIAVTWDMNYSEDTDIEEIDLWTDDVVTPEAASRAGYTFIGWFTDDDCALGCEVDLGATYGDYVGEDTAVTFYAAWTENPTYSVTYDLNGGSGDIASEHEYEAGYEMTISSAEPTMSGYEFEGWSSSFELDTTLYQAGDTIIVIAEDMVLTAQWSEIEEDADEEDVDEEETTTDVVETADTNLGFLFMILMICSLMGIGIISKKKFYFE